MGYPSICVRHGKEHQRKEGGGWGRGKVKCQWTPRRTWFYILDPPGFWIIHPTLHFKQLLGQLNNYHDGSWNLSFLFLLGFQLSNYQTHTIAGDFSGTLQHMTWVQRTIPGTDAKLTERRWLRGETCDAFFLSKGLRWFQTYVWFTTRAGKFFNADLEPLCTVVCFCCNYFVTPKLG